MNNQKDVPVYLFTGFLEAGKTKFIQETLEDKRFCNGERSCSSARRARRNTPPTSLPTEA